jgi:hypothetical protein
MANQEKSDRKDRNGGGDVTKAEKVETPSVEPTVWDLLNQHGSGGK